MYLKTLFLLFILFNLFNSYSQTYLVQDIGTPYGAAIPGEFFNGWHYFRAMDSIHGQELWKTQGDTAFFVEDLFPGLNQFNFQNGSFPSGFTEFDGKLYFIIKNDTTNNHKLVSMDSLEQFNVITTNLAVNDFGIIDELIKYNGKLYYFKTTVFSGTDLIEFDGTSEVALTNININNASVNNNFNIYSKNLFIIFQNKLMFGYSDCWTCDGNFYLYDGNSISQGPEFFNYLGMSTSSGSISYSFKLYDFDLAEFQNKMYYIWHDSINTELRSFDGINIGVVPFIGEVGNELLVYNNMLIFNGNDGVLGYELWEYDGVNLNIIADIYQGSNLYTNAGHLAIFNDKLYFHHIDTMSNSELWWYDGVDVGQEPDINVGLNGSDPSFLKVAGPYLYFSANDGIHGNELWRLEACEIQTSAHHHITACEEYELPNGLFLYASDTYYDTILNSCGEDSVLTIHVTIGHLDNSTTTANYTISANQNNANYQWINCEDNSVIMGENMQDFSPVNNGEYAVVITNNETGCSDTSDCVTISGLSISITNDLNISIYPNPSNGNLYIKGLESDQNPIVQIYNSLGQAIPFTLNLKGGLTSIQTQSKGVLFIHIKTDNGTIVRRVVVE